MPSLRDHGLPNPTPIGKPTWKKAEMQRGKEPICPNCGAWLCEVQVRVKMPLLRGGEGISTYFGCPACPYASPSVNVAVGGGS